MTKPAPYPVIPFPGEKFCPIPDPRSYHAGIICSEPTAGRNADGVAVRKFHLAGTNKWANNGRWAKKTPKP